MTAAPIGISNSEIQTFQKCRRRWYLQYYQRWKPKEVSTTGPLALGSRVHAALESYYKEGTDLVEQYNLLLNDDIMLCQAEGLDITELKSEGELGRIMCEGYLDWVAEEGIDANYEVIGVEEILRMPMLDGAVEVIGKIDLRVQDKRDDSQHVLDHKTAAQLGDFEKWAHMNPQLMTYMTLDYVNRKGADPDQRLAGGVFRILKKVKRSTRSKPPYYSHFEIRHNVFTLRSFWKRLNGVLANMMAVRKALDDGHDHRQVAYPTPTRDCSWWCPFVAVCPMFDSGDDTDGLLNEYYTKGDPYDYYGSTSSIVAEDDAI